MSIDYVAQRKERAEAVNRARTKAQVASEALEAALRAHVCDGWLETYDTAKRHYDRCIAELEDAINANGDD